MFTLLGKSYQCREYHHAASEAARERVDRLIKPVGSLGRLEELAVRLAGIYGRIDPRIRKKALVVMAGDHGVVEEQIASAPQVVTYIQAVNIARGCSGVGALAKATGTKVYTVDIAINSDYHPFELIDKRIADGCRNIADGPAMSREQAEQAITVGIEMAHLAIDAGANLLGIGEMGIGNTTPTTAILSVLADRSPGELTGVGANFPVDRLPHKAEVIERAIRHNRPISNDPVEILAKLGGYEIAGMTGVLLGAATRGVPAVIDGYISTISALLAVAIDPACRDFLIPSHASKEKSAALASEMLGLRPFLDMEMRLGEGSGSVLAMSVCEAACAMINDMITFEEAGIGTV